MIKSLCAICAALLLLTGAAFFEHCYVVRSFGEFSAELSALCEKTDAETATEGDAEAVRISWEARKEKLHIWLPHNDVNRVDDTLSEIVRLVAQGDCRRALAKLEILLHLARTLPAAYRPSLANIF